jgi:hypothetical protein
MKGTQQSAKPDSYVARGLRVEGVRGSSGVGVKGTQVSSEQDTYVARDGLDLDDHGDAVAAAEAEGGDAALAAGAVELVDEGGEDAGAAAADGVAQGDAAAADVEFGFVHTEFLDVAEDLGGEGFVDFEEIDVVDGTPLLDIKPYVPAFDVRTTDQIGWFATRVADVHTVRAGERGPMHE